MNDELLAPADAAKARFKLSRQIKDHVFNNCGHVDRDYPYDWCPSCVLDFIEARDFVETIGTRAADSGDVPAELSKGNSTCRSGDGDPRVEIRFKDLKDAQAVHRWLAHADAHAPSTTGNISEQAQRAVKSFAAEIRREGFRGDMYQAVENLMDEIGEGEDDHALDILVHLLSPIIQAEYKGESEPSDKDLALADRQFIAGAYFGWSCATEAAIATQPTLTTHGLVEAPDDAAVPANEKFRVAIESRLRDIHAANQGEQPAPGTGE